MTFGIVRMPYLDCKYNYRSHHTTVYKIYIKCTRDFETGLLIRA